jgi:hypothetical protein
MESKASSPEAQMDPMTMIMEALADIKSRITVLETGKEPQDTPVAAKPAKQNDNDDDYEFPDMFGGVNTVLPKTPKPRRDTISARQARDAEEASTRLVMQAKQPPYDHIKLQGLSVGQAYQFFEDAIEYQTAYSVKLSVTTLVSHNVKRALMSANRKDIGTMAHFHAMTLTQLQEKVYDYVRPVNKLDFAKQLERYVEFHSMPNHKPTPSDFKPFYNALLEYRNMFVKIYEVMAGNNDENLPPCKNKPGGLIFIFLNKIPFEYGSRVFQIMPDAKYKTIYEFVNKFYQVVEEHFECSKASLKLRQAFGGTEWVTKNSKHAAAQKIDFKDLNAVPAVEEREPATSDSEAEGHDDSSVEFDGELAAMQKPPVKDQLPCIGMMLRGECNKPDCKYTHRADLIMKKREEWIEDLKKAQSTSKVSLLRRSDRPAHLSNMEVQTIDSEFDAVRKDLFFANMPSDWYVRAIHREGKIETDAGNLTVHSALFDSGALTASYISDAYVAEHLHLLEPYLQSAKGTVRLAAEDHTVSITQCANLEVSFSDTSGKVHRGKIRFYVLPGSSNTMVIGLPAIVSHFSAMFMDMIQQAVDEYSGEPSHNLHAVEGELCPPWSQPLDEEAPEDLATPLPCSFSDALHYMEMSVEEAREEFLGQIEEHVSAEFRASTRVVDLLKTKGMKAFVPANWEGIKHVDPLELIWNSDLPERLKPRARPLNPKLGDNPWKEFQRLLTYFYEPSNSPIASCLVVAPKATAPFIRFCGDYVSINKYIVTGHYPIPHVQRSLDKICGFSIFLDIDLVNAFHQVPLAPLTSERLSVQTPWGQVQPKFMPEGIAPATFVLQQVVSEIFSVFEDWTIAIFDNLLVLAHDYADAYAKLEKIIDRCIEYNVYLKFSKSWLGFDHEHFFGYDCKHNSYALGDKRKKTISDFPMPHSQKQMQSFLGATNFFKNHVVGYAQKAAILTDMTHKDFPWHGDVWTTDRVLAWEEFKIALLNSFAIFYPNYELPWIMRTDASTTGVAFILFQVYTEAPDAEPQHQPILMASQKFSKQATRWTTIEQEAYGIYFAVLQSSYYLRCKEFVVETDHANLQWMEASAVPKIVRWRIYLQSFTFSVRHIAGKKNLVADWLSRVHEAPLAPEPHALLIAAFRPSGTEQPEEFAEFERLLQQQDAPPAAEAAAAAPPVALAAAAAEPKPTPEQLFAQVHGGRMGHHGARRTWRFLCELFPGHGMPYRLIEDMVSSCAICQKDRLGMTDSLQPIHRSLQPPYRRKMVGVDTLTVTPPDKWGNEYINVVVVHATKLVALYPSQHKTALDMALALFQFFSTYGVYESLISDPGSDLTSEVVKHLTSWYGVRHVFSLVDRHESNGVEGTNKSILRHLRALVADERVADRWSDPSVLCLVQYILNSQVSHETGVVPFHAHFGTEDATYFKLPEATSVAATTQEFVRNLDANLRALWAASQKHQTNVRSKRSGHDDPARQNQYQPGDLVLLQRNTSAPAPSKLSMRYMGPYEVISQLKNDVQCKHLCVKTVHTFHVERLKMFFGSRAEADRVARLDHDQYEVDAILYWRGSPDTRTTMEFYIRYKDGDQRWVTWSKDLFDTVQYEEFCRAHSPLFPLIFTATEAQRQIASLNATPITAVSPGRKVFVDLRSRGNGAWYEGIGLPRSAEVTYVLPCAYTKWLGQQHRKIALHCEVTGFDFKVDHLFVRSFGTCFSFDPTTMVMVDKNLIRQYPKMMP